MCGFRGNPGYFLKYFGFDWVNDCHTLGINCVIEGHISSCGAEAAGVPVCLKRPVQKLPSTLADCGDALLHLASPCRPSRPIRNSRKPRTAALRAPILCSEPRHLGVSSQPATSESQTGSLSPWRMALSQRLGLRNP